jgi:hypothetical protein
MPGFDPRIIQPVAEVLRPADISQLVTYNCCSKHFVFWRTFCEYDPGAFKNTRRLSNGPHLLSESNQTNVSGGSSGIPQYELESPVHRLSCRSAWKQTGEQTQRSEQPYLCEFSLHTRGKLALVLAFINSIYQNRCLQTQRLRSSGMLHGAS